MARWLQSKGQRSLCLVSEMQPKKCCAPEPTPAIAVASEVKK